MGWWPWGSDPSGSESSSSKSPSVKASEASTTSPPPPPTSSKSKRPVSWNDSLNATDWDHYKEPRTWLPTLVGTATILGLLHLYRSYLRRIPGTDHIQPGFFRKRSLFGRVTSVGDGDNFHLFHTPGGRLAGWGWARKVPTDRKALKGKTIPVRLAGIDAPEGAHFGRPGQPYSAEALSFLTSYILGRNVRARIWRRDQYERVVGTVHVRRWLIFQKDVGLEMLKRGLATTYEAKTGAEFGGLEEKYRRAEANAKQKKKGMWSGKGGSAVETPREFKNRMAVAEKKLAGGAPAAPAATWGGVREEQELTGRGMR